MNQLHKTGGRLDAIPEWFWLPGRWLGRATRKKSVNLDKSIDDTIPTRIWVKIPGEVRQEILEHQREVTDRALAFIVWASVAVVSLEIIQALAH